MSFGILGSGPISQTFTEYQIYQAPSVKKAVGTITVCNNGNDGRIILFTTSASGSVSGMYAAALSNTTSQYGFLVLGGLCKQYSADDGIPLVVSGVVLGPSERLIALSAQGTNMYVSFNGIEEDV